MKNFRTEYPRPQFQRNEWFTLNGEWEFEFDDNENGEVRGLPTGKVALSSKIIVPFTYQTKASGIGDESDHFVVWYRRSFTINKQENKRALLNFNGADYVTDVWVNGVHVAKNVGAYAPFSADITNVVNDGENVVVVRCFDTLDNTVPRGKQSWKGKRFECWYIPFTGIWQSVWVEFIGEDGFAQFSVSPSLERKSIFGKLETFYGKATEAQVNVTFGGKQVASKKFPVVDRFVRYELEIADEKGEIKLWNMENPNLYGVEYVLFYGEKVVDRAVSRVGMREISINAEQKICLNGEPIYQRLVLDQGYWKDSGITPPSVDALKKDIELSIAMGFNGARKHQKVEDPYWYYLADEMGFLTWCEMPSAYNFTETEILSVSSEWQKVVATCRNFTSVITYVPFNESWGVGDLPKNKYMLDFTRGVYYLTKAIDDTRLVSTNDGWENPNPSDFLSIHDYAFDDRDFEERYIKSDYNKIAPQGRIQVAGVEWSKGEPIIFSEYGGVAMKKDAAGENWGYGESAKGDEEFYNRINVLTQGIFKCPFQGYCYTQLSDVQQEVNGLLDEDHNPKFNVEKLYEIFTK